MTTNTRKSLVKGERFIRYAEWPRTLKFSEDGWGLNRLGVDQFDKFSFMGH